jgi:hypothetical protein
MARLKVYRTAIGFHDAYVAAPSQKAALAAWGTDKDLFARGAAEVVTDPALGAELLATPGIVLRRVRGTAAEQIAALGATPRTVAKSVRAASPTRQPRARPTKPPRPGRDLLDIAESALDQQARRHAEARAALAEEARELAARKRAMIAQQAAELAAARARVKRERQAYEAALTAWRKA